MSYARTLRSLAIWIFPHLEDLHQRRIRIQDPKLVEYHQRIHCTTYMMCLDSIIIHRVIQILIANLSSYGEFVRDRTGQGTVSPLGHQS